ncbi:MAG: ferredoxin family protein [Candidatus Omnitrophota bacterium]|nr:ferredoxin family protein [Candidatus Omnitrophota bacterium]
MEQLKAKDTPEGKHAVCITVNERWCKKCGICIAFCPQGVFVPDDFGMPLIKYPEKCVKCMLCVVRCPDLAVEVKDTGEK